MSKPRVIICLLRNDLRYLDNEALLWAHRQGTHVLPIYCFDPRHYKGTYHFSLPRTGPHQLKFMLESIRDLKSTLQKHGSDLILRQGKPEVIVPAIIQQIGKENVSALVLQKEVTDEEVKVEEGLKKSCGVQLQTIWGATLYHLDDLPFKPQRLPDVYTQFRKTVESQGRVRPLVEMPETLRPLPEGVTSEDVPTATQLGCQESTFDERSAFPFTGGESSALARLKSYAWETDAVAKYKETRNGLIGHEYSTKFSSWLAHGCISPRQIYWEIKNYESQRVANQSTYWVIFELLWRDYFRFVGMKYGNKLFFEGGIFGKQIPWKRDENLFKAWKEGRTGVPFVDANMRELAATGFMSNRGRQNVASFLTKDLKLDWRMGAEWFESMPIDHDVCSNYGNWLYSAGIGNDPREDRKFNMIKQGLDYDAEGDYVRLWVPELKGIQGGQVHTVWTVGKGILERAGVSLGETYPMPIVQAPEWARHFGKTGGARAKSGRGPPPTKQNRGIDFYFKST
uniref:Cryptochrome DASH n=1 Tax=Platynereis dumerilii TaxID=6359 RepID=A0A075F5Q0_PLADU|nr:CRY-DASH [Platynereis dumerilii]